MKSFVNVLSFLLLLVLALRLVPGSFIMVLVMLALVITYVRHAHRTVIDRSHARLRAHFDQNPDSDNARRLMQEAGYNV